MKLDPLSEIIDARQQARAAGEPLVDLCFLATAGADGAASARTLVLRDVTPAGLCLMISSRSPKWDQLQAGGSAELLILWRSVLRQYRLRGSWTTMPDDEVERYWAERTHGSRLLDLYHDTHHPQSHELPTREEIVAGIEALRARYPSADSVPRPASALGLRLVPDHVDCWHGSPEDSLHERWLYRRDPEWSRVALVP